MQFQMTYVAEVCIYKSPRTFTVHVYLPWD